MYINPAQNRNTYLIIYREIDTLIGKKQKAFKDNLLQIAEGDIKSGTFFQKKSVVDEDSK